ncbi:MAG TPA: choice-of-anchor Q domain-containing protein [Bacteroidales bacterium]|nr:choice-of-anchor Q domain-containing protein [Bacteroidales bacterium]
MNCGISENKAWKTLEKLGSVNLAPGNKILFKRGTDYSGCLTVNCSGTSGNPILISDYGDTKLHAPSFTNVTFDPDNKEYGNCIRLKSSYIIVENLYFHNTVAELPEDAGSFLTMWELGALYIDKNAHHCTIKNNEFFDCGVGIKSYGQYAKIENNYIHDCNRVLKKWNWGPIGIWLGADYQEVCFNKIINYRAENPKINWGPDGYGGGADGSAIEIDDARNEKSNIRIHHNYSRDCQGFLEVTWTDVAQHPAYLDFKIHHNVSDDYQQFIALWQGAGCYIENNTIIRRKVNENEWGVFNITQHNSRNIIRNNIVVTENDVVIFNLGKNGNAQPNNIIENNIYWAAHGKLNIGMKGPGKGAFISNPMLLNYSVGLEANDFSLSENSCAIDAGLNTEYRIDFNGTEIPQGNNPDIGAFEFQN